MDCSERTWPLPNRSWFLRMRWHDLLFMHWPVAVSDLEPHIPNELDVDTFEGQAWIGVVPFRMSAVAPRSVPSCPWLSSFPEVNVRTYVRDGDKGGVWFFSLDATNPIAVRVARRFFHLKYMDARMSLREDEGWYHYLSRRTHRDEPTAELDLRYRPIGKPMFAEPGSLEFWLTARYCLYTVDRHGQTLRGEIDHPPWPLQQAEATVARNSMLASLELTRFADEPHLLFAKDIAVKAWTNESI